jgi:hypothetical protein
MQTNTLGLVNKLQSNMGVVWCERIPSAAYLVSYFNIPSVEIPASTVNGAPHQLQIPGNELQFGPFRMGFTLDQDIKSWYEVFIWMRDIQAYMSTEAHINLGLSRAFSTISLYTLGPTRALNREIRLMNAWPQSLGEITMDIGTTTPGVRVVPLTFLFNGLEVNAVDPERVPLVVDKCLQVNRKLLELQAQYQLSPSEIGTGD